MGSRVWKLVLAAAWDTFFLLLPEARPILIHGGLRKAQHSEGRNCETSWVLGSGIIQHLFCCSLLVMGTHEATPGSCWWDRCSIKNDVVLVTKALLSTPNQLSILMRSDMSSVKSSIRLISSWLRPPGLYVDTGCWSVLQETFHKAGPSLPFWERSAWNLVLSWPLGAWISVGSPLSHNWWE